MDKERAGRLHAVKDRLKAWEEAFNKSDFTADLEKIREDLSDIRSEEQNEFDFTEEPSAEAAVTVDALENAFAKLDSLHDAFFTADDAVKIVSDCIDTATKDVK